MPDTYNEFTDFDHYDKVPRDANVLDAIPCGDRTGRFRIVGDYIYFETRRKKDAVSGGEAPSNT